MKKSDISQEIFKKKLLVDFFSPKLITAEQIKNPFSDKNKDKNKDQNKNKNFFPLTYSNVLSYFPNYPATQKPKLYYLLFKEFENLNPSFEREIRSQKQVKPFDLSTICLVMTFNDILERSIDYFEIQIKKANSNLKRIEIIANKFRQGIITYKNPQTGEIEILNDSSFVEIPMILDEILNLLNYLYFMIDIYEKKAPYSNDCIFFEEVSVISPNELIKLFTENNKKNTEFSFKTFLDEYKKVLPSIALEEFQEKNKFVFKEIVKNIHDNISSLEEKKNEITRILEMTLHYVKNSFFWLLCGWFNICFEALALIPKDNYITAILDLFNERDEQDTTDNEETTKQTVKEIYDSFIPPPAMMIMAQYSQNFSKLFQSIQAIFEKNTKISKDHFESLTQFNDHYISGLSRSEQPYQFTNDLNKELYRSDTSEGYLEAYRCVKIFFLNTC